MVVVETYKISSSHFISNGTYKSLSHFLLSIMKVSIRYAYLYLSVKTVKKNLMTK